MSAFESNEASTPVEVRVAWPTDAVILAADLMADALNWALAPSHSPHDGINAKVARDRLNEYRRLRRGPAA